MTAKKKKKKDDGLVRLPRGLGASELEAEPPQGPRMIKKGVWLIRTREGEAKGLALVESDCKKATLERETHGSHAQSGTRDVKETCVIAAFCHC